MVAGLNWGELTPNRTDGRQETTQRLNRLKVMINRAGYLRRATSYIADVTHRHRPGRKRAILGRDGGDASCMSDTDAPAVIHFAGPDLFVGISPSGHAMSLDTDRTRNCAPSPVELLLIGLGSCTAVDVITILQKKRQQVTAYHVEVRGERREEHPRRFTKMAVHHVLTGRNLSSQAVAQAIELSETKYCSVAATLRPGVEILSTFETIEENAVSET
jgi:putative redox protein